MSVGANSYGLASDVSALTWAWVAETNGGYDGTTFPTLAQVEGWIDQVSAVMNAALAKNGFTIPVTQADAVLAIKSVVVGFVAELADRANATGRFFTERNTASTATPFGIIRTEINDWVEAFADGLENLGAERDTDEAEFHAFSFTPTKSDGYHDEAVANES